jgi:hypothetical protein
MHRKLNSLCIGHLRFPFWPSIGAAIGTKSWRGKNNHSNSTPSLGTILRTKSPLESESQEPNALTIYFFTGLVALDSYSGQVLMPLLIPRVGDVRTIYSSNSLPSLGTNSGT